MTTQNSNDNKLVSSALNRRQLFGIGGTSILGVALLAACSHDTPAATHVGESPALDTAATGDVTDVVLLRTAASLEYSVIDAYDEILKLGLFSDDFAKVDNIIKRIQEDHLAHAKLINQLVSVTGGTPITCANERINRLYIAPTLLAITGDDTIAKSPTPPQDALALAIGLENLAAATYQSIVSVLHYVAIRDKAIHIGQQEARHATVLVRALSPKVASIVPTIDATGTTTLSALPTAFGTLSAITVSAGVLNDSGIKPSINFDTPSLNSLMYESVTC